VNKQGTSSMVKKQPMVKSDTNACAKINENANAERKLSMSFCENFLCHLRL